MYEIKIKADFSAAHRLKEVGGKCEALHGHNYTVEVAVESETLNEQGMVMDFRALKTKTWALLEALDHRYLNELPPFQKANPSAENLAAYIYAQLSPQIDGPERRINEIVVWESATSRATYRRPNP
jgi:6-pyruvoyltetrahydropterin/6-carboxytetrahydropterin synthase